MHAYIPLLKQPQLEIALQAMGRKPALFWTLYVLDTYPQISTILLHTQDEYLKTLTANEGFNKVQIHSETDFDTSAYMDAEAPLLSLQVGNPFIRHEHLEEAYSLYQQNHCGVFSGRKVGPLFPEQDSTADLFEADGFLSLSTARESQSKPEQVRFVELPSVPERLQWIDQKLYERWPVEVPFSAIAHLKMLMIDVDGVLTDAGMYYSEQGDELKKFNTHDGMGIKLLRQEGIKTAILTSEETAIVARRAKKLKVDYLYQGLSDKPRIAREIAEKEGIGIHQMAFIGDDFNDFRLLSEAGTAACPANARPQIKSIPGIIQLNTSGGGGAVREFAHLVLDAKRRYYVPDNRDAALWGKA